MTVEVPLSVWPSAQMPARAQRVGRYLPESVRHPARMLPAIARTAITEYTAPGDLVLDPMCGIGTTLVEAVHAGRVAVGVEYEQEWADLARANIDHARKSGASGDCEVITGDALRLSELVAPLAHQPVAGLLDAVTRILASCYELLRPGGVVVLTVRPFRRAGELIDLPAAVLRCGDQAGLLPYERNVALLAGLREDHLVPRASFFALDQVRRARRAGRPLQVIAHEDLLVFRNER